MREAGERAEARRTLGFLQALRQAIPASLDDKTETKACYDALERGLIARANGTPPVEKRARYTASRGNSKKPIRRAPMPARQ